MNCFISLQRKVPLRPQRMDVIQAFSDVKCSKIIKTKCNSKVDKKHDSYQRVLLRRKAQNICRVNI